MLRPSGGLVAIWNMRDESVGWTNEVREVIDHAKGETPRHQTTSGARGVDSSGLFGPLELREFEHVQEATRDEAIGDLRLAQLHARRCPTSERAARIA